MCINENDHTSVLSTRYRISSPGLLVKHKVFIVFCAKFVANRRGKSRINAMAEPIRLIPQQG